MSGYDGSAADTFDFHHSMLTDDVRTSSFLKAIVGTVKSGDVVVDIGSGTGALSLFAVRAGASHVYSIEREPVIGIAREIAQRNGLAESITFVEGSSIDIEIPEPADVLITETIGNTGFDEGIISWVADAKERFLKPHAAIIPEQLDAVASLVTVPRDYEPIERWSQPLMTLDFTPLSRIVHNNCLWTDLSPAAIATPPTVVFGTDFSDMPTSLEGSVCGGGLKDAVVHGIGVWFRSILSNGVTITNSPPNAVPSWAHGFLPLAEPVEIRKGESVCFKVWSSASGAEWKWSVGSGPTQSTDEGQLEVHETMERLD